jgi:hypothetical protein
MDPGKDASNRLKLGTAVLYSAAICMHYRQIGCAKSVSVVNNRMSKLLKPAFAVHKYTSAQRWVPYTATCSGYSTQWDYQLTQWD